MTDKSQDKDTEQTAGEERPAAHQPNAGSDEGSYFVGNGGGSTSGSTQGEGDGEQTETQGDTPNRSGILVSDDVRRQSEGGTEQTDAAAEEAAKASVPTPVVDTGTGE